LIYARVGAELEWSRVFKARLAAGEYRTLGDPPWGPKKKSDSYTGPKAKPKKPAKPAKRKAKR
jgi:hypothetical protein